MPCSCHPVVHTIDLMNHRSVSKFQLVEIMKQNDWPSKVGNTWSQRLDMAFKTCMSLIL